MSTTSSVDDYAAIAARLNEIEGVPSLPEQCDALRNRASRQEAENALRRELLETVQSDYGRGPPVAHRKVMCTTCFDTGHVRRRAGQPGFYVEEPCPNCGNPNRKPPP